MCLVNRFFFLHLSALDSNNDISFQCFSFFKRNRRGAGDGLLSVRIESLRLELLFFTIAETEKQPKKKLMTSSFCSSFLFFEGACLTRLVGIIVHLL